MRVDLLHEFAKRSLDSKILVVSRELSHKNALKAHQNGSESVECSNLFLCAIIMSVFSLKNVLKSISNNFDGLVGRKDVFK